MLDHSFEAFNTVNTIAAYPPCRDVLLECERLCHHYEKLFDRFDPQSELSSVNSSGGQPIRVSAEFDELINEALRYCKLTNGLFDVTAGTLCRLWDFHTGRIPSPANLTQALRHVDYRLIHTGNATVRIADPETAIDLGGIAKGYIADKLIAFLKSRGVTSAIVNLGGNVACLGAKPNGNPWRIGIRRPVATWREPEQADFLVEVNGQAVVTSGVYERMFYNEGTLFHHILDPKTGMPAQTDLLSATVVARTSLEAEGLSTALIIMGADKALSFVQSMPHVDCILITDTQEVVSTLKKWGKSDQVAFAPLGSSRFTRRA